MRANLPELDRNSPITLHQQIFDWIKSEIISGNWSEHYQLMAETDMAQELGVNRGTLRNALKALIDEGLLVRIHGKGTFVASSGDIVDQPLAETLMTFSEGLTNRKIAFQTKVIDRGFIQPENRIASSMTLKEDEQVFLLERVRSVRGEPLMYLKNYVVARYCQGIETVDFSEETLFNTLESRFELHLDWGRRFFSARLADETVAKRLDIVVGDPVMYIEQVVHLGDSSPVELSHLWVKGDRFRISATVKRDHQQSALDMLTSTLDQSYG